jgi:hypothetical protein
VKSIGIYAQQLIPHKQRKHAGNVVQAKKDEEIEEDGLCALVDVESEEKERNNSNEHASGVVEQSRRHITIIRKE